MDAQDTRGRGAWVFGGRGGRAPGRTLLGRGRFSAWAENVSPSICTWPFQLWASEQRKRDRELAQGEVGPDSRGDSCQVAPEAPRPEAAVWPGATRGHGFGLGSHVGALWAPRSSYPRCSWRSSVSQRSGGSWCRGPPGLRVFSCPGSHRPDPPRSSVSCPSTSIKQLGSFEVVTSR